MMAVSGKEALHMGQQPQAMATVLAGLAPTGWTRLSAGEGS